MSNFKIDVIGGQALVYSFTTGLIEVEAPSFYDHVKRHKWAAVEILLNRAGYLESQGNLEESAEALALAIKAEEILLFSEKPFAFAV